MKRFYRGFGRLLALLNLLMIVITVQQVLARYLFQSSSVAMQEMEWHLFGTVFLLAGALTLRAEEHVRVDIFYQRLPPGWRSWVDVLGVILFLTPMMLALIYYGWMDMQMARSYATDLSDYRPLLWLAPADEWQGSRLFALEGWFVELLLKGEASANPGGLPARWIIKAMLPLASILVLVEGWFLLGRALRSKLHKEAS